MEAFCILLLYPTECPLLEVPLNMYMYMHCVMYMYTNLLNFFLPFHVSPAVSVPVQFVESSLIQCEPWLLLGAVQNKKQT